MITEDEAKTKWCPYARVVTGRADEMGVGISPGAAAFNRVHQYKCTTVEVVPASLCIGSACMAWRWEPEDDFQDRCANYEDAGNIGGITSRGPEPEPLGFCGLAGRPS